MDKFKASTLLISFSKCLFNDSIILSKLFSVLLLIQFINRDKDFKEYYN